MYCNCDICCCRHYQESPTGIPVRQLSLKSSSCSKKFYFCILFQQLGTIEIDPIIFDVKSAIEYKHEITRKTNKGFRRRQLETCYQHEVQQDWHLSALSAKHHDIEMEKLSLQARACVKGCPDNSFKSRCRISIKKSLASAAGKVVCYKSLGHTSLF